MITLKKVVIILTLLIPTFLKGGEGGFLLPSTAEAYTYQDVENAYNDAVAQYPNDYIFIEEFEQDGQKGYKIWKRPTGVLYSVSEYWLSGFPVSNTTGGWPSACDGSGTRIVGQNYGYFTTVIQHIKKYCDGSENVSESISTQFASVSPCHHRTILSGVNCAANDVLLATFFPIVDYTLQTISGSGQTGSVGQALKEPFIVIVTDNDNMPKGGAGIQWNITSAPPDAAGTGLTNTMLSTGSDGMASATLILGDKEGEYAVEASCEECSNGSPVTFTATAIGVKIELTLNKSNALPDENITVTVKATKGVTGEPEPNYPINLEDKLEPKGHGHSNDPPQWKENGNTDANGILTKTYSNSISGNVTITAISGRNSNIKDSKNLTVLVNLAPLGTGTNYILTGAYNQNRCNGTTVTSQHSSNHYGTEALNNAIINIANDYATLYHGIKLRINDMSLQWGGLFDIYNNYQTPHSSHKFGRNADIEFAGVNSQGQCVSLNLPYLYQIISETTYPPLIHSGHYHITVK